MLVFARSTLKRANMLVAYILLYLCAVHVSVVSMKACEGDHFHKENFFDVGEDLHLWCNGTSMGFLSFKTAQVRSFVVQVQFHGQSSVYRWIKSTQAGQSKFNITEVAPRGSSWEVKTSIGSEATIYTSGDFDVHFIVKNASPLDTGMYTCYLKAECRRHEKAEWEEFHGISQPVHYSLLGEPRFPENKNC